MSPPNNRKTAVVEGAHERKTHGAQASDADMVASRGASGVTGELLLEIRNLRKYFYTYEGVVRALEGVSLKIHRGETFGLVGESGSGKSVSALTTMGLGAGKVEAGEIRFKGESVLGMSDDALRDVRGNQISMIFQEPMTALNPVYTIGNQIAEVLLLHDKVDASSRFGRAKAARRVAVDKLREVGIPNPERVADSYPHELSGGMRQRAMIAMMMACEPDLLIADEPTTALDVTIEAQILDLMRDLQRRRRTAIWLITHDLGVVAELCHTVGVMYAGYIVEYGTVDQIFGEPRMPYTLGLMEAIPRVGDRAEKLSIIPGRVPNLLHPPTGCRFHPRCPLATEICKDEVPPLEDVGGGHLVACHHKDKTVGGKLHGASFAEKAREIEEKGEIVAG